MAVWLIVALERLPVRVRGFSLAVGSAFILAGAIVTLTLLAGSGPVARRQVPAPSTARRLGSERRSLPNVPPPVSANELARAASVAGRFLAMYLPFAYGRASVGSVAAITRGLRRQLIGERAQVTPADRGRRLRVLALRLLGMTAGFVVATASVDDGGIAAYPLRFTLEERAGRWLVDSVRAG